MNRSNITSLTSLSFTVDDDLISETSINTNFIKPKPFNAKPFSKDFGPKGAAGIYQSDDQPIPIIQRKIILQAQNDAYKELNNELFNPFEHKLHNGFLNRESDLYERQKQKQIESIKKKQMDLVNSAKNYTITFKNNTPNTSNSLKMTAQNVLNEDSTPSISDFYNQKFKNRKENKILQDIDEENQDYIERETIEDKKSDKKIQKQAIPRRQLNSQKQINKPNKPGNTSVEKVKIIKSSQGWKRQFNSEKSIEEINFQKEQAKKVIKNNQLNKPRMIKKQEKKIIFQEKTQLKNQQNINFERKNEIRKPPLNTNLKKGSSKKSGNGQKKKYSQIYEGGDKNLVQQLQKQITECPSITFNDIAQLDTAKGLLQEAVLLPRMMPQFFKGIRKAMKGILLFGPPGTGKTLLAKAIASNNMFFNVSASSLASKWKGESEKMVRLLFEMARYHSPSVIFFDEIDCIASKRSENEHESTRKVKTELLVQMDGVGNSDQEVFVLAATNRPWDLDEALRRRLEKRIYIPLPGKEGRRKMFEINMKELKAHKLDWEKVIEATKGCSGADICNICRDAAYMPMRRKISQVGGISKLIEINQKDLLDEEITEDDLLEAAKKIKPSVSQDDLKKYSDWMKEFGSS